MRKSEKCTQNEVNKVKTAVGVGEGDIYKLLFDRTERVSATIKYL